MKSLISVVAICFALASNGVFAHGDHGMISGQNAINIATKSVQKMTFKDMDFDVGKLDESWKSTDDVSYTLHQTTSEYYVIKAENKLKNDHILIVVSMNGQVVDVKKEAL